MNESKHWLDRQLLCDEVAGEVAEHRAEQSRKKANQK